MKLRLPAKNLMIIMCLLVILSVIGGCIFNKNSAVEPVLYKTDAWCEIQEFNLTIVQNRTIIPVTEEDLKPFPEFGIYLRDINNPPPTGNTGTRVVKVIDCNSSRAIQFLTLYRKYEDFPNQPVLEYRGHFYEMGFEYLESHSTGLSIALNNSEVKGSLTGVNYTILDVGPGTLTSRSSLGVINRELTRIDLDTDDALLTIWVDVNNQSIVYINNYPKRSSPPKQSSTL